MKIAVLTQPLGHNYGGLLQAFALQRYLIKIGYDVETIDRRAEKVASPSIKSQIRNMGRLLFGRIKSLPTEKRRADTLSNLVEFRDRKLTMSPKISSSEALKEHFSKERFAAVIVGSDQVWRLRYSPNILNFYLDFIDDIDSPIRKVSYAASFGVEEWEYPPELTAQCGRLLRRFDAVSVRENSAVSLCQEKFGIEPRWVVDPTLLLDSEDYIELLQGAKNNFCANRIVAYILERSDESKNIIDAACKSLECAASTIIPETPITHVRASDLGKCRYPSVEFWIQSFKNSRFVITDSFHGTVFAILFNRPFISIGNPKRGMARFESLLSQFDLEDRLVHSSSEITQDMFLNEIDWRAVNLKRRLLSAEGQNFIKENLPEA